MLHLRTLGVTTGGTGRRLTDDRLVLIDLDCFGFLFASPVWHFGGITMAHNSLYFFG